MKPYSKKERGDRSLSAITSCVVFLLLTVVLFSCKKKNLQPPPYLTLASYVASQVDLSITSAIITRTGFSDSIRAGGPYSFFLSTDAAYTAAGLTKEVILKSSDSVLLSYLKYATLFGEISPITVQSNIKQGFFNLINNTSINYPLNPIVTRSAYGLFINGNQVTQSGIAVTEGIVNKVDGALIPPIHSTLKNIIDSIPELSTTAYILNRVPSYAQQFDASVYYDRAYRIFRRYYATFCAPNNDAWRSYNFTDTGVINSLDSNTLKRILTAQILTDQVLGGATIPPPIGIEFGPYTGGLYAYIQIDYDGITLVSSMGIVKPKIVRENIAASNGVVNIIDQVNAK